MRLPLSPPLVPDADEARELAERELAKATYDNSPTLIELVLDWLAALFSRVAGSIDGSPAPIFAITLGIVAVVVAILLIRSRKSMGQQKRTVPSVIFADDDVRSTTQIRSDAAALAASGNWREASIEQFRAIVSAMADQGLVVVEAGLTAHEASGRIGAHHPGLRTELNWASNYFDGLFYGDEVGNQNGYEQLRVLDNSLAQAPVTVLQ